jgi:tetratricopeptide (TPR) repeat protein
LKYIDLPIPELYDLSADAAEERNVIGSNAAAASELQHLLDGMRAQDRGVVRASESAETRERLRALGYVTSAAPARTRYTEADDPKRLVSLDRGIEEVVSRYQRGDLDGAIARGEQVVQQRPDMPLALLHLAFLYNEAGNHRAAADAGLRALALNPSAEDTAALVAAYLSEAGRAGDAIAQLEPYVRRPTPDVDVLIAYGVALATVGRRSDALAAFERARAIDPTSAMPLVNTATVYMLAGDTARATETLQAALAVDPGAARAHNALGVIAAERRDYAAALEHWRRAVALDPRDYQTLYNLGDLLIRLGRPADARPYWEQYVRTAPPGLEASDIEHVTRWLGSHR